MIDEDEVGLKKKSQNTLDTLKRLHRNKTRSTRVRAKDLIPNFCHHWDCGLEKCRCVKPEGT